jgi:uncharacterized protein (DUF433 family)
MAILTNLDAVRSEGLDELIRRVHHDKEDYVIEDQTLPVAAVIDINKYQLLNELLQKAEGTVNNAGTEPKVRGSDVAIREIAEYHQRGDTINDLEQRFPLLSRSQIYSALAYYYDHAEEIDQLIAARRAARSAAEPSASVKASQEYTLRDDRDYL